MVQSTDLREFHLKFLFSNVWVTILSASLCMYTPFLTCLASCQISQFSWHDLVLQNPPSLVCSISMYCPMTIRVLHCAVNKFVEIVEFSDSHFMIHIIEIEVKGFNSIRDSVLHHRVLFFIPISWGVSSWFHLWVLICLLLLLLMLAWLVFCITRHDVHIDIFTTHKVIAKD